MMARIGARGEESKECFERAIALFEAADASHAAARVEARLAESMWDLGRLEEGLERMNRSFELLSNEEPDADLATLAAQLGRFMFFGGQPDLAMQRIESALDMAESLVLPEVLAQALTTKGDPPDRRRGDEKRASRSTQFALGVALEHDKPSAALRASYNLADSLARADRYAASTEAVRNGLAHARRVGNRYWELSFLGQLYPFLALGEWDEALAMFEELPLDEWTARDRRSRRRRSSWEPSTASAASWTSCDCSSIGSRRWTGRATNRSARSYRAGLARLQLANGDLTEALASGEEAFAVAHPLRIRGRTRQGRLYERLRGRAAARRDGEARASSLPSSTGSHRAARTISCERRAFVSARTSLATEIRPRQSSCSGSRAGCSPTWRRRSRSRSSRPSTARGSSTQGRADEAEPLLGEARPVFERLGARRGSSALDRLGGRGRGERDLHERAAPRTAPAASSARTAATRSRSSARHARLRTNRTSASAGNAAQR